jgi:hypothetical protein
MENCKNFEKAGLMTRILRKVFLPKLTKKQKEEMNLVLQSGKSFFTEHKTTPKLKLGLAINKVVPFMGATA